MQIIEMRQARALAGVDTSKIDAVITRRILNNPRAWEPRGASMIERGWADN
jgi:hypothetical protein